MKRPLATLVPLIARGIAPSAAVASGLLTPLALGASGDLDPGFADVGRLGPITALEGPVWSIEALDDGGALMAGGNLEACDYYYSWYCYYYQDYEATNFVSRLSGTGSIDPGFDAARLDQVEVFDVAMQPDGKVVAVGRRVAERTGHHWLAVFRLEPDGPLDTTFGENGIVELSVDEHGLHNVGQSVVLDPDGRIVVAGSRDGQLLVLRLLADGALDGSFGNSGVAVGPGHDLHARARILRTAAGGYRVTATSASDCRVVGLTAGGALDGSFGAGGIAPIGTSLGGAAACHSMASQADGNLLVTGNTGGQAFATRLLATGAHDPAFVANAVADEMSEATAIAVGDDGAVLVGGGGVQGTLVMRLQANGELDPLFGNAGRTWIDLPSAQGARPRIYDLEVRPDGSVTAAGGDYGSFKPRPFVIRLLGEDGGDGPGVLSAVQADIEAAEPEQAVVKVRRTGGKTGEVSIAYETAPSSWAPATAGQDFGEVSGRLTWADGDASEREIVVQVHDNAGDPEEYEQFRVSMSDVQGGAGIGTRNATVNILPDGEPAGQFALEDFGPVVSEFETVQLWVYRNYYREGAVSVTVTPVSGTASAGDDFVATPMTLSWADQDVEPKLVEIPINNDTVQEEDEIFTVELSDPTGGAIIGPRSVTTITIVANDAPVPPRPGGNRSGGGGALGYLSLLFLGLAELFRSLRRATWERRPRRPLRTGAR